jgi:transcriptional regulator with XRE-family HTH domain
MTLGLSQRQLAELIGVTDQQVWKYEHGTSRVSAGRLYEIARELGVPVEGFFRKL